MKKLTNWLARFLPKQKVMIVMEPDLTEEALYAAFAATTEKHPLLRAVHQVLDDSLTRSLTDAVDGETMGEANALQRGEAKALLDLKTRLLEIHADARRRAASDDD